MAVLRARPQRLRRICRIAAAVVGAGSVGLAAALPGTTGGGGSFRTGDRTALVGIGVLVAVGILTLARPRIEADERHIIVRNLISSYELTWEVVRAVRFTVGSPWASLDLVDDERIAVMAVMAIDAEYTLAAVTTLRGLLASHQRPDKE